MYRKETQKFRVRPMDEIKKIIDVAEREGLLGRRVFIGDGNALVLSTAKLLEIFDYCHEKAPLLERITMYANVGDILRKSVEDLKRLRKNGLSMVYIGFESGDDVVLKRIEKGANFAETVEASKKLKASGIMNSVIVLLGVGGKERSTEHAIATGKLLTACDPEYVGVLSLQLRPGAPIYNQWREGQFELPEKFQMIEELKTIVENTELSESYFYSNHISNYLPIKAKFPKEKQEILKKIKEVLKTRDESFLRPDYYRDVVNQY